MSKIFNILKNNLDRTWYTSSNILYSECDDIEDSLKIVRITFKGGRTYEYKDVDVNDYLYLREASSQGQTFSKIFSKKYKGQYITDISESHIKEELNKLINVETNPIQIEASFGLNEVTINKNGEERCFQFDNNIPIFDTLREIFGFLNIKNVKLLTRPIM